MSEKLLMPKTWLLSRRPLRRRRNYRRRNINKLLNLLWTTLKKSHSTIKCSKIWVFITTQNSLPSLLTWLSTLPTQTHRIYHFLLLIDSHIFWSALRNQILTRWRHIWNRSLRKSCRLCTDLRKWLWMSSICLSSRPYLLQNITISTAKWTNMSRSFPESYSTWVIDKSLIICNPSSNLRLLCHNKRRLILLQMNTNNIQEKLILLYWPNQRFNFLLRPLKSEVSKTTWTWSRNKIVPVKLFACSRDQLRTLLHSVSSPKVSTIFLNWSNVLIQSSQMTK